MDALFIIPELLLQQRKKRISMVSMESQNSLASEEDRNDDKCKHERIIISELGKIAGLYLKYPT